VTGSWRQLDLTSDPDVVAGLTEEPGRRKPERIAVIKV
jgi:hypothetical protein